MVGWILVGTGIGFIVLAMFSIMRISSECSRAEEERGEYGTVGWATDKWDKYSQPTEINNGTFEE